MSTLGPCDLYDMFNQKKGQMEGSRRLVFVMLLLSCCGIWYVPCAFVSESSSLFPECWPAWQGQRAGGLSTSEITVIHNFGWLPHTLCSLDIALVFRSGSYMPNSFPLWNLGRRFLCKDSVMYCMCFLFYLVFKRIHLIALTVLVHDR